MKMKNVLDIIQEKEFNISLEGVAAAERVYIDYLYNLLDLYCGGLFPCKKTQFGDADHEIRVTDYFYKENFTEWRRRRISISSGNPKPFKIKFDFYSSFKFGREMVSHQPLKYGLKNQDLESVTTSLLILERYLHEKEIKIKKYNTWDVLTKSERFKEEDGEKEAELMLLKILH